MARKERSLGSRIVRGALALAGAGVLWFAVQGGEWSTVDLIRQTSRVARIHREVDSLSHVVDSLKKYKELVLTDPVTQEKIAREEFGMVRGNKEILYRFVEPDSGSRKPEAGSRKP